MAHRRRRAEAGVSLISLIVVVVSLGVMAAIVVKAVPDMGKGNSTERKLMDEITGNTTTTDKDDRTTTTSSEPATATTNAPAPGPGGMFTAARQSECKIAYRTLATAMEAAKAQYNAYPTEIPQLISIGMLSEEPRVAGYTFTLGTPESTGATVLVNGQPTIDGCSAPAGN